MALTMAILPIHVMQSRLALSHEVLAVFLTSAACLALYDMAKAVDRGITIDGVRLLEKSGGRSKTWKR